MWWFCDCICSLIHKVQTFIHKQVFHCSLIKISWTIESKFSFIPLL
jgi:hypothetical protein